MSDDDREFTFTDETITTGQLELIGHPIDTPGIARPGDILVLSYDSPQILTVKDVEELRQGLKKRLPGLADIVVIPFRLAAIYRQDDES